MLAGIDDGTGMLFAKRGIGAGADGPCPQNCGCGGVAMIAGVDAATGTLYVRRDEDLRALLQSSMLRCMTR